MPRVADYSDTACQQPGAPILESMTQKPEPHLFDQVNPEDLRFALRLVASRPWKQEKAEGLTADQREDLEEFISLSPQRQAAVYLNLVDRYLHLDEDLTAVESAQASSLRHLLALLEKHGDPATFTLPENTPAKTEPPALPAKDEAGWELPALIGLAAVSLLVGAFATIHAITRR